MTQNELPQILPYARFDGSRIKKLVERHKKKLIAGLAALALGVATNRKIINAVSGQDASVTVSKYFPTWQTGTFGTGIEAIPTEKKFILSVMSINLECALILEVGI